MAKPRAAETAADYVRGAGLQLERRRVDSARAVDHDVPVNTAPSDGSPTAQDEVLELWRHVEQHFENDAAHEVFLQACVGRRDLTVAARLYRGVAEQHHDAETRDRARQQLDKLTGLAWTLLKSDAKPPPQFKKISTWLSVVMCAILLFAVAIALHR